MPAPVLLLVDPTSDPIAAAKWTVEYETELENLRAEAKEADTDSDAAAGPAADVDAVAELVERWIKYAPMNAPVIQALHAALQQMGFTLKLSEARGDGGPRTYVRVLRADGKSAGYLDSSSFKFVGSRHDEVVKTDERIRKGGKYPLLPLSATGALDLILEVAARFVKG